MYLIDQCAVKNEKKAKCSRCCAVFGHFLYCFASFDSRDFKFSATSDRKGPGCVAEFCAMRVQICLYLNNPGLWYSTVCLINLPNYITFVTSAHINLELTKAKEERQIWYQYQYLGNCAPTPPLTQ